MMEIFTLNRDYEMQDIITEFTSIIWTERYYGDSQVELVVPSTPSNIEKLPEGIFLGIDKSEEIMILETADDEEGKLKFSGISVLPWLNNRFIRTSDNHEDKYWYIDTHSGTPASSAYLTPGKLLWDILFNMCCEGSSYLGGPPIISTGIPNPERLIIPRLVLKSYDTTPDWKRDQSDSSTGVKLAIPYGPVYDAMRVIATTYEIGMRIIRESNYLKFQSYKGVDRSSNQNTNPIVRFSSQMDSLTNIKELRSIAALKTVAYAFAPENPNGLATGLGPGISDPNEGTYTGFDLRALQIFADDITTDVVGGMTAANLTSILNARAGAGLAANPRITAVDGEIVPTIQFKYGVDYNLGDLIEIEGNSGITQVERVTEYIRSQDAAGEKAYPTLTAIGQE